MRIWRISNYADLNGLGGLRADGRWHHRGYPVVYCTESPAAALLEVVVHLEIDDLADIPNNYQLLEIEFADSISRGNLDVTSLPDDWRHRARVTRSIGDHWLAQRQSAILAFPNAIVPHTVNFLINPLHPDTSQISILSIASYPFDDRLFKIR